MISHDDIHRAYDTIRPYLRRTPVIDLDLELAGPVTLKLEQLQCAGSFKARGAFTNLLVRDVPPVGVAAASGGNHGVAVAYAAHRLGMIQRIRHNATLPINGSPGDSAYGFGAGMPDSRAQQLFDDRCSTFQTGAYALYKLYGAAAPFSALAQ